MFLNLLSQTSSLAVLSHLEIWFLCILNRETLSFDFLFWNYFPCMKRRCFLPSSCSKSCCLSLIWNTHFTSPVLAPLAPCVSQNWLYNSHVNLCIFKWFCHVVSLWNASTVRSFLHEPHDYLISSLWLSQKLVWSFDWRGEEGGFPSSGTGCLLIVDRLLHFLFLIYLKKHVKFYWYLTQCECFN